MDEECMPDSVTVLLPVYNGKRFIAQQIDSILDQTHKNILLSIIDDCSVDGSYECIQFKYGHHPNVKIKKNDKNIGQLKTLELLLQEVSTPFFAFSDQDDIWNRDKIEKSLHHLIRSGSVLSYTDLSLVDENLDLINKSGFAFMKTRPYEGTAVLPLLIRNPISGCTIVAKKELIERALPFPQGLPMYDRWFGLVGAISGGISCLREATLSYRQHQHNLIGGVRFSLRGFFQKVSNSGNGTIGTYLRKRLDERKRFAESIILLKNDDPVILKICDYYRRNRFERMIRLPSYMLWTAQQSRYVGFNNVLLDWLLTSLSP